METHVSGGLPSPYPKKNFSGPCFLKICVNNVLAGSIIGKNGSVIHGMEGETGCAMKLSPSQCFFPNTQERLVVISGKQEQLNRALLAIIEKLRESPSYMEDCKFIEPGRSPTFMLKFVVPKSAVSAVIGKGGAQIKQLQEVTGAKIQASNREEGLNERIISISGSSEALQRAALAVATTIQSDPNLKDHLYVVYTPNNTPALAAGPMYGSGPYGSPSYIQPSPGGMFPPAMGSFGPSPYRAVNDGMVPPSSPPVNMSRQYSMQSTSRPYQGRASFANTAPPPYSGGGLNSMGGGTTNIDVMNQDCEIVLHMPDSYVGAVIGKNGVCLSDIIYASGAKIRLSAKGELVEGTQNRRCVVKGTVTAVHHAHIMLLQRMEVVEAQQAEMRVQENWH